MNAMNTKFNNATAPSEDGHLAMPPRLVSTDVARYLTLIYLQIPLALVGFGLIAFWGNCGFGADYRSLLFLLPLHQAQGRILRFEPTGAREATGFASYGRYATVEGGDEPIEAVYFSYQDSGGRQQRSVCYTGGASVSGSAITPVGETAEGSLVALNPGGSIPVEYVAQWPGAARVRGTRTGIYGLHMLIVLIFPGVGLLMLLRSRRFLPRLLLLLKSVPENPPGFLPDPEGVTQGITLSNFPFSRLSIRAGQIQAPMGYLPKLCFTPLLALLCNLWYIADNSKAIFYPIKALLGHGR